VRHPLRDHPDVVELIADRSMERYRSYLHGQVRELLTRYGVVDYVFFDFSYPERTYRDLPGKGAADWGSAELGTGPAGAAGAGRDGGVDGPARALRARGRAEQLSRAAGLPLHPARGPGDVHVFNWPLGHLRGSRAGWRARNCSTTRPRSPSRSWRRTRRPRTPAGGASRTGRLTLRLPTRGPDVAVPLIELFLQ